MLAQREHFRLSLFLSALAAGVLILWVAMVAFWVSARRYTESAYHGPRLPEIQENEAIVVLAGDSNRISQAFALLRTRNGPLILLSGVEPGIPLVTIINQQGSSAINIHETWGKVITESQSRSTVENAEEAEKILREKTISQLFLVTSDYHMTRALAIFRATFPNLSIVPYAVSSEFSILTYSGMRKFFLEFWKYVFYLVGVK